MRIHKTARRSANDIDISLGQSRTRLLYIAGFFTAVYLVIILRLFDLTVIQRDDIKHHATIAVKHSRPDILDRNGMVLATSLNFVSLYANPSKIVDVHKTAEYLATVLSMKYQNIYKILSSDKSFVWIKRYLAPKEQMLTEGLGIVGIGLKPDSKRVYPQGYLFSHLLGYVDIDGTGISGIEKYINSLPEQTDVFKLTVDLRIQNIVREELMRTLQKYQAICGTGIVMNAQNGEIIAMVSLPDFDSNKQSIASPEQKFNHATLAVYEMGSIFKIFTLAAALDGSSIKVDDIYDVSRPVKVGKFQISDFKKSSKPELNVQEIFIKSSNIGMAKIALQLGQDKQMEYLKKMYLFAPLSVEIPEKSLPIVPKLWSEGSLITISYGYGMAVTPLHVIQAVAALVNSGILYPATLMLDKPQTPMRIVSDRTSNILNGLLRLAVKQGTGRKAEAEGYMVGGKTGSAEKIVDGKYDKNANISSFVGVFPMTKPRYVVLVLVDEARTKHATGGEIAAPVVKSIINRIAPILNVTPERVISQMNTKGS